MLTEAQMKELVHLFGNDEAAAQKWLTANPEATNRMIAQAGLVARASAPAATITTTVTPTPPAQDAPAASAATVTVPAPIPTPEPAQAAPVTTPAAPPAEREIEMDEELTDQIVEGVLASETFAQLATAVQQLTATVGSMSQAASARAQQSDTLARSTEARIVALEKEEGDKRAQWIADLPVTSRTPQRIRATFRPRDVRKSEDDGQESSSADVANATLAHAKSRKLPIPQ